MERKLKIKKCQLKQIKASHSQSHLIRFLNMEDEGYFEPDPYDGIRENPSGLWGFYDGVQ